jgi:ABC-type transporter Mla maintaining outer membrane lipid asymmetry permease subunit MlaE
MSQSLVERLGGETLHYLEYVGRLVIQFRNVLGIVGRTLPLAGNRNRWRSTIQQMRAIGVDAFPMVGVMVLCAGFILAMQGASELSRLGAIDFVVDLVTIGFARELARASAHRDCGERTFRVGVLRGALAFGSETG